MRPKVYMEHPVMSADEIRERTQGVWDRFYSFANIWKRSRRTVKSLKARLAFVLISKIYRQMYANTGIATDSARVNRSAQWARLMAIPCRRLFAGRPDARTAGADPGRPSEAHLLAAGHGRGTVAPRLSLQAAGRSVDCPAPLQGCTAASGRRSIAAR